LGNVSFAEGRRNRIQRVLAGQKVHREDHVMGDRRCLVLLLLGIAPEGQESKGISGITRLQKFLYLLEREEGLQPTGDGFGFIPYKAGPFSSKLYDDLEFLENLGLIQTDVAGEATEPEAAELDLLSFEDLLGDGAEASQDELTDGLGGADAFEERRYRLTKQGEAKAKALVATGKYGPAIDAIRRVKSRFGNYSLSDLLRYVYTKYPDSATESEIRDKILRGRRVT